MEEVTAPVLRLLDVVESAVRDLESSVERAIEDGVDVRVSEARLDDYFSQFEVWLEAHRYQADPAICRESIPASADSDHFEDWAYEFTTCLAGYLAQPIVQEGLDAADRLNSITPELIEAWS